jgi:hypothetical protein
MAKEWNRVHQAQPPFRLSVVDAWQLTDHRPETTTDGRHWISESLTQFWDKRSRIGEAEGTYQLPDSVRTD